MSNTRKVYPAKPEWSGKNHPRHGDPEFPKFPKVTPRGACEGS